MEMRDEQNTRNWMETIQRNGRTNNTKHDNSEGNHLIYKISKKIPHKES